MHNNQYVPVRVYADNGIAITNSGSNNKPIGKADDKYLFCGIYKNQYIPFAVDDNGRLIA